MNSFELCLLKDWQSIDTVMKYRFRTEDDIDVAVANNICLIAV